MEPTPFDFREWCVRPYRHGFMAIAVTAIVVLGVVVGGSAAETRYYQRDAALSLGVEVGSLATEPYYARATRISTTYGPVRDARASAVRSQVLDTRTAFGYVLLSCQRGPVLLRADLRGEVGTRLTEIEAVEVEPGDAPARFLSEDERTALDRAIATRGGLSTKTFTLASSDG